MPKILLMLLIMTVPLQIWGQTSSEIFSEAYELYSQGKLKESLDCLRPQVTRPECPVEAHRLFQELMIHVADGGMTAIAFYDSLAFAQPDNPCYAYLAGKIQISPYRQCEWAKILMQDHPGSQWAWLLQGAWQERLNAPGRAVSAYQQAAALDSCCHQAWERLAVIYMALEKWPEAEYALSRAEAAAPWRIALKGHRLAMTIGSGDVPAEQSQQEARRLMKQHSGCPELLTVLTDIYYGGEGYSFNLKFWEQLQSLGWHDDDEAMNAYFKLVTLLDVDALVKKSRSFLERYPFFRMRRNVMSNTADRLMQSPGTSLENKIAFFREWIALEPWNQWAYNSLVVGYALTVQQDTALACQLCRWGLDCARGQERRWPYFYLGKIAARNGDYEQSVEYMAKAQASADSSSAELAQALAMAYEQCQAWDEAMYQYSLALVLGGQEDELSTASARCFGAMGRDAAGVSVDLLRQASDCARAADSEPVDLSVLQSLSDQAPGKVLLVNFWEPG